MTVLKLIKLRGYWTLVADGRPIITFATLEYASRLCPEAEVCL